MGKKIQIDVPYSRIEEFCRKWNIIELSLFGSALREDFRPESDIDVLVTFAPEKEVNLSDLLNMEDELKQIFGREVDLVQRKSIERSENYIRRKHILNSLEVVYKQTVDSGQGLVVSSSTIHQSLATNHYIEPLVPPEEEI